MKKYYVILLGIIFSVSIAIGTSLVVQQAHKYYVKDQTTANKISIESPALAGSYTFKLPPNDGDAGSLLLGDGAGTNAWTSGLLWNESSDILSVTKSSNTLTSPPTGTLLHVGRDDANPSTMLVDGYGAAARYATRRSQGTMASPTATTSGATLSQFIGFGRGATNWLANPTAGIFFYADETFTDSTSASSIRFQTTPSGSISSVERMRITPNGELLVNTTTANAQLDVKSSMALSGSTSGYIKLQSPASPTSYTLTLPAAQGAATQTLVNDGAGNLSWGSGGGGGGSAGGSNTNVQYNSSGTLAGSNNFVFDNANTRVGIGTSSPLTKLHVGGSGNNILTVNSSTAATDSHIEIGQGTTGNRNAFIDLSGDDTYNDYGLRIFRAGGTNSESQIYHRGTGALKFIPQEGGTFQVNRDGSGNAAFDTAGSSLRIGRQDTSLEGGQIELLPAGGVGGTQGSTIDTFADSMRLGFFSSGAGKISLVTNGAIERLAVNSDGNIAAGLGESIDAVRYFDLYNVSTGNSAAANFRLLTRNALNTGLTTVDLYKQRVGGFIIQNADNQSTNYTMLGVGGNDNMRLWTNGDTDFNQYYSTTGQRTLSLWNTANSGTPSAMMRLITYNGAFTHQSEAQLTKKQINNQVDLANTETDGTAFITFTVGTQARQYITSTGRVFFPFIHNNSGGCSSSGDLCSGTWSPTLTNCTTAVGGKYTRIGNIVQFSIRLNISSGALCNFTLPVASDMINTYDCLGTAVSSSGVTGFVGADATGNQCRVENPTATSTYNVTGQYVVQ